MIGGYSGSGNRGGLLEDLAAVLGMTGGTLTLNIGDAGLVTSEDTFDEGPGLLEEVFKRFLGEAEVFLGDEVVFLGNDLPQYLKNPGSTYLPLSTSSLYNC